VPPPPPEGPAIQQPPQQQQSLTPSQQKDLKPPALPGAPAANGALAPPSGTATPARAASPSAPTLGGHSLVAKRATSPKLPRLKGAGSRATSPLAGAGGSRATSPVGSQPGAGSSNKRKAEDGARETSPPPPKAKKRKADEALGPLTDTMLVEWLKRNPGATTRTCIGVFGKYAKDEAGKAIFTQLVKKVATMKDNILILRAGTGLLVWVSEMSAALI
jgi:transcription initiation factor TFIIF subunit alpha